VIRIAIDIQTLQTSEKERGIGRFVAGQVKSLLSGRRADDKVYTLVGNERFPAPVEVGGPVSLLPMGGGLSDRGSAVSAAFADWAIHKNVDLIYFTSPLRHDIALPGLSDSLTQVAMVHDLIPLLFEDRTLSRSPGPIQNDYFRRLGRLNTFHRLLTYSECNREDLECHLGIPEYRVNVVGAAADPSFRPRCDPDAVAAVRHRYGVRGRLILSVTGFNFRKNIEGTVASFARLPAALRGECQLLLACGLASDQERAAVEDLVARHGVQDRVLLPGHIGEDLPQLYHAAEVFFLPTLYEGFGIPILEAMSCGVPVVASAVSAVPEVVGNAAILVDPNDEEESEKAIRRLLGDGGLRADLRQRGLARAREFSWERVAARTVEAFDQALERDKVVIRGTARPRPRLLQVSPLPPVRSGIADYAERLGVCLSHRYQLSSDSGQDNGSRGSEGDPGLRILYHVGNSFHHYPAFRAALEKPGVVVLHDWSLHGMIHYCTVREGNPDRYRDLMFDSYGLRGRYHADKVIAGEASIDFLTYPLSEILVRSSRGIVVHSRWMLERVTAVSGHPPVRLIPHGADIFEGHVEIAQETAALGLPTGRFVILCFGRINRHKRIDVLLRAFQRFHQRYREGLLVLAGEIDESARGEVLPLLERSGLGDSLCVLGYVPLERLGLLLRSASVCVNLRFPTLGETSGSVLRALGMGRPAIVTDAGAFRELPDDCVWKVPVDRRESDLLFAYLEALCLRPEVRRQMGVNARAWVRKTCLWERVSAAYASFLEDCYDSSSS
jgi:glycosyltransferase involved in cell wall biosynthesis